MVASSKLGYQATSKEDYLCAHVNLVAAITATVSKMYGIVSIIGAVVFCSLARQIEKHLDNVIEYK